MSSPIVVSLLALLGANPSPAADPVPLAFSELVRPTSTALVPTAKLLSLKGRRVRLTGFMARMELPSKGAFWLTQSPVFCDEAGAGTGDLPPSAVFVVVRSLAGEPVPFTPRLLEVTGVLEVGYRAEPDGRATHIRLILDRLEDLPSTSSRAPPSSKS
ncbi:MAG: hypothetical protein ACXWLF_03095 [Myxococcaceae bacterium]